ncbi:MAG TPA: EB domain-containing protein, partial [Kofleriaceae bacterium]|nr:EB domain-containing protein [Kofleriaceae bacterium]
MRRALAIVVAGWAGCYGPTVHPGSPCGDNQVCPDGLVCSPASQTCELTAVFDATTPRDGRPDVPPDVQTSAFHYRRRLTIHNGSATQLPAGFAIRVQVGVLAALVAAGKIKPDYSDLRVIGDLAGERDRIVDPATGPAPPAITFALAHPLDPGATTLDYALYYGDPTAGPAPATGGAVFTIYDDFTAGIATFWGTNDGPTTTAGELILRAGHTDAIATTAASDNLPLTSAVELVSRVVVPTSDPTVQTDGTFYYWFGYQKTGTFTPVSEPWVVWIARGKSEIGPEQ